MIENALLKQLLEAGAHFGHHTSYWHPKAKKYIFTQRNSIHIIDLEQTVTTRAKHPFCRHQKTGPADHGRGGCEVWYELC